MLTNTSCRQPVRSWPTVQVDGILVIVSSKVKIACNSTDIVDCAVKM